MKTTQQDHAAAGGAAPTPLHIRVGENTYTAEPADGPITIGRELPAQIQINDPYISRIHVRLEPARDHWVAVDQSRNGVFVDGKPDRQPTVAISDGTTIRLGNPDGVAVSFGLTRPPAPTAESDEAGDGWTGEMTDPGVTRAGAAVAARRDELGIAQRELARQKIINAGALISFEKGRSWPRRGTLAKLEEVLQWAPGTIARIRYGGGEPGDGDRTELLTNTVQAPFMAQAVELALEKINANIGNLPAASDADFGRAVGVVLADLRKLENVAANAARSARGAPEVAIVLSAVRKSYSDVMLRAARSPGATLGQRLFAARHRAELNLEETANAAGLPVDVIIAAEADAPLPGDATAAVKSLLFALTRR